MSGIIEGFFEFNKETFKGEDNEIIEECDSLNVSERERYWISKLNSTDSNVGYNISNGG